jgi:hypothetical protein
MGLPQRLTEDTAPEGHLSARKGGTFVSTVGQDAALRRWRDLSLPDGAKAIAMVTVTATSLYCDKNGLRRGSSYLLAVFDDRLLIVRATRKPEPKAVLLDFAKGTFRITDIKRGKLNTVFVLSRPYGSAYLRLTRFGRYAVNDEVLDLLVATAARAEDMPARTPSAPVTTAGTVKVFAQMCASYGPGAEQATAVVEADVLSADPATKPLGHRGTLLLATFPDRLVLLDPDANTHAAATPVAAFTRGSARVVLGEPADKHVDVDLSGDGREISLRLKLYSAEGLNRVVTDAIRSIG